eukprot:128180-Chlamydomonas_euryale.AAC.1
MYDACIFHPAPHPQPNATPSSLRQAGDVLSRAWCMYEAWTSCRKGRNALEMLSYGVDLEPLQK